MTPLQQNLAKAITRTVANADLSDVVAELQKPAHPLAVSDRGSVAQFRDVAAEEDAEFSVAAIFDSNVLIGMNK